MTDTVKVGSRVRRIQGRPESIGRTGIVMTVYPDVIGSAGDVLIKVIDESSGTTFECYTRQVVVLA